MKRCNSLEEYTNAFREHFKDNWETVVKQCQNWLNGERSYFKVGWLECIDDEKIVKDKLGYANKMLAEIDYHVQRYSYTYEKPQRQKDNDLSFIGESDGWAHSPQIRVPSLKRKTAWNRFYKMFPDLKGMKIIHGCSSCYGRDADGEVRQQIQHSSTIKLKKIWKK